MCVLVSGLFYVMVICVLCCLRIVVEYMYILVFCVCEVCVDDLLSIE